MDWRNLTLQSIWKMNKEKLIFLFCGGLLLFVLSIPGDSDSLTGKKSEPASSVHAEAADEEEAQTSYEAELEARVSDILAGVDGVGEVEVMVVLKKTEEKEVFYSISGNAAESEIYPEVTGIIISADGGGNTLVKTEISEAMEALFGLPAHKIKILKRVKKESEE